MSRPPLIKSRLLLGNKILGDLMYDKDRNRLGYLKFSIPYKFAGLNIGYTGTTTLPAPPVLTQPARVEPSYKFGEDLLSVKIIPDGGKEFYHRYQCSVPPSTCLFILRVRDWTRLDDSQVTPRALVLNPPPGGEHSIMVVFSFPGPDGKPLAPNGYASGMLMGTVGLPETRLPTFCIGVVADRETPSTNDIEILLPPTTPEKADEE